MTPILLLTRPEGRNEDLAADVQARWAGDLQIVTSPLLRIIFVVADVPDADEMIFTSTNGVDAAVAMGLAQGQPAWCVGDRTAEAATAAGFAPRIGPGDAAGLVAHIIAARPAGRLAHIRGKHTRGDVAERLNATGLSCADVVAYDQAPAGLSDGALAALSGKVPVIAPLFSSRTASILKGQGPFAAPLHVAAISDAVAQMASDLTPARLVVAEKPDAENVVAAIVALLDRLPR